MIDWSLYRSMKQGLGLGWTEFWLQPNEMGFKWHRCNEQDGIATLCLLWKMIKNFILPWHLFMYSSCSMFVYTVGPNSLPHQWLIHAKEISLKQFPLAFLNIIMRSGMQSIFAQLSFSIFHLVHSHCPKTYSLSTLPSLTFISLSTSVYFLPICVFGAISFIF